MTNKENMVHWNLYIKQEQKEWLKNKSQETGEPMSRIVREAIDMHRDYLGDTKSKRVREGWNGFKRKADNQQAGLVTEGLKDWLDTEKHLQEGEWKVKAL